MKVERGCVVFTANRGYALSNSRAKLINAFVDAGWHVVLATSDDSESRGLCGNNVRLEPMEFGRNGLSPLSDFKVYRKLFTSFRKHRPMLVHNFHARPIIMGSLAARNSLKDSTMIVNTVTGLGQALIGGGWASYLAGKGFKSALRRSDVTIFQNRDDQREFVDRGWMSCRKSELIISSGVDLQRFRFVDRQKRTGRVPTVVLVARLLKQKGIPEFVRIAESIKSKGCNVRFVIAGEEDPNHPDAVSPEWIRRHEDVEYLGRIADIEDLLDDVELLLFPSTYREGAPRVVLEAAATGLPTVAFDVPGVREVVQNEVTGFLVPPNDVEALERKVSQLLQSPSLRRKMGIQAREFVEKHYSTALVNEKYLEVYRRLGADI